MARIKVEDLGEGQHPSEVVIGITTADGVRESVIVDRRSVENNTIDVGYPVGGDDKKLLVELPRETTTGRWRVWMNISDVLDDVTALKSCPFCAALPEAAA